MASRLVYLAGPITGCDYNGATEWREFAREQLAARGVDSISPMDGKYYLADETSIGDHYDDTLLSTKRGITCKDRHSVMRSDVVLFNFLGATRMSGGSFIEAGWADAFRKPVIYVIEDEGNPNEHGMMHEIAGYRVDNMEDALDICAILLAH